MLECTQKLKYPSFVIRLFAVSRVDKSSIMQTILYVISLEKCCITLDKTNYSNVSAVINLHTVEFISNFIEHECYTFTVVLRVGCLCTFFSFEINLPST